MAPQTETRQTARIEQIEEAVATLQRNMSDEVSAAVNKAAAEMQQALVAQITTSLDQVIHKLQVRIDRVRENNETLVEAVKERQDLQSELRSTMTALKLGFVQPLGGNKEEGASASSGVGSGGVVFQTQGNNFRGDKTVEDPGGQR